MLDAEDTTTPVTAEPAGDPAPSDAASSAPAKKAAKKATKKATKKAAAAEPAPAADEVDGAEAPRSATTRKTAKKAAARPAKAAAADTGTDEPAAAEDSGDEPSTRRSRAAKAAAAPMVLFQAPEKVVAPRKRTAKKAAAEPTGEAGPSEPTAADELPLDATEGAAEDGTSAPTRQGAKKTTAKKAPARKTAAQPQEAAAEAGEPGDEPDEATEGAESVDTDGDDSGEGGPRRRRRRGGRRRRRPAGEAGEDSAEGEDTDEAGTDGEADGEDEDGDATSRRRRTRVRKPRNPEDEITSIGGSTRLEAKKQRRREGREAGRRRAPIVSEAEFLARREAVDRVMVIRQRADLTQIAVLEDKVLVEHYVARESQTSLIGNIYLGRVQNVLPSMEAAFVDIGKGRNAVIYAGEVNWAALGHKEGQPRKVESVLKSGQTILVQVTKDPVGHKGARLTGQISLPGRFLVYVPDGNTSGISRKLPDTERNRLKTLLKEIVPDTAGVIVRTAAEGATEEELTQDVERLTVRWAEIEQKVAAGRSPDLLYGEPDLTLKVVRDLFTEDFNSLIIEGDDAWDLVDNYVEGVAPDLRDRLVKFTPGPDGRDVFASHRVDEQIAKGLDRKVWLPSGGSLVIDRTEAMTVVDVNTGKFTGSGGNLEETVTKNNLEAAEEIVRQLRLRDIGGIIVVDFIDMVLESNRDLVLRRLVECLGRDRTRHQVAEVTSLGLVQMTRKRIGTGLLEAFSEDCDHCKGRGVLVHEQPIEPRGGNSVAASASGGQPSSSSGSGDEPRGRRSRGGRGRNRTGEDVAPVIETGPPSPMALAGTKPHVEPPVVTDADGEALPVPAEVAVAEDRPVASDDAAQDQIVDGAAPAADSFLGTGSDDTGTDAGTDAGTDLEAEAKPEPVAAPIVVTTTRRRRAGRPAGPAGAVAGAEAVAEVVPQVVAEPVAEETRPAGDAPEMDPVDPEVDPEVDADADGDLTNEGEPGTAEDGTDSPSVFHVPIKKKGSRKR